MTLMDRMNLIAKLLPALAECDGIGSFNRRGDREVVLTFASHEAGNAAFEALDQLVGAARDGEVA